MSAPQSPEPSESASNDQKPRRATRAGTTSGNCALTRKPAICCRVTGSLGQKLPPPQPPVIPRRASSSINGQNGLLAGTSLNISSPGTQAGGLNIQGLGQI